MSNPTIKEQYYQQQDFADHLICDVITSIIEIPEVREAVLVAALRSNYFIGTCKGIEMVADLPFQVLWDHLMDQEPIKTTPLHTIMTPNKEDQS